MPKGLLWKRASRRSGRLRLCQLLLLVHGLEINFRQMHRGKASALDQVRYIAAQIGVNNLWASNTHDLAHLVFWHVADFKNTGLFGFDQKHRLVLDFGVDSGCNGYFKHTVSYRCCFNAQLNVHCWLLLLQQNCGGIGLFQRRFFEIHALDLENRGLV